MPITCMTLYTIIICGQTCMLFDVIHLHFYRMQPRDPCPSYPVNTYTFNITEKDSNILITTINHTGNSSLTLNDTNGLLPYQVYIMVIEAENSVGSTTSEKIPLCKSVLVISR